jgi:hypothetical protein
MIDAMLLFFIADADVEPCADVGAFAGPADAAS